MHWFGLGWAGWLACWPISLAPLTCRQLLHGDLEQVPAGALVGEGLQLLAPVHVLNLDFVVQRHRTGKRGWRRQRRLAAVWPAAARSGWAAA